MVKIKKKKMNLIMEKLIYQLLLKNKLKIIKYSLPNRLKYHFKFKNNISQISQIWSFESSKC